MVRVLQLRERRCVEIGSTGLEIDYSIPFETKLIQHAQVLIGEIGA